MNELRFLFILRFLYTCYLDKFNMNPYNVGKRPKGCFVWCLLFVFKSFVIVLILIAIIFAIVSLVELFSN